MNEKVVAWAVLGLFYVVVIWVTPILLMGASFMDILKLHGALAAILIVGSLIVWAIVQVLDNDDDDIL